MRILLADDSVLMRTVIGKAVREWGFEVIESEDGSKAWETLQVDHSVQIAILDWQMPGYEGPELCKLIRQLEGRYIYTIVLTAQSIEDGVARAIDQGADDYVVKSAPLSELCARLKAASRIVELQHQLRHEGQRLARAQRMESLGSLAAGMAHELNTPIQYISHNTEFIQHEVPKLLTQLRQVLPAQTQKELDLDFLCTEVPATLEQTIQGLKRVQTIIEALRDFTSPISSEWCCLDIRSVIRSATSVVLSQKREEVALVLELQDTPLVCECVPQDIAQMLIQLLQNSVEAIVRRGEPGTITVKAQIASDCCILSIHDTGAGIAPDILPKIFDPFFSTKTVGSGLGHGLAAVHSIVYEHHRGSIEVTSNPHDGTTFSIALPVTRKGVSV